MWVRAMLMVLCQNALPVAAPMFSLRPGRMCCLLLLPCPYLLAWSCLRPHGKAPRGSWPGQTAASGKVNSWPPAACFQAGVCLFPTSLSGFAAPGLTVAPEPHPVCTLLSCLLLVFGPAVSSLCRDTPPPAI